jgi:type I restriction enzyme R subunit
MSYNEEDTKLHLITPALQTAGWRGQHLTMEYPITAGQIVLQGDSHRQLTPSYADYLLRYAEALPIGVVEAKEEAKAPGAGLQQAKEYAEKLGLRFAFASNGHGFELWDFTTNTQRTMTMAEFPSPDALWQCKCAYDALAATRLRNPLLHPSWRDPEGRRTPRYYQEVAVNRVLEAILRGQQRILINLATGTGKTFIAAQIVWKLLKSGYFANKRILFLADRVVLRNQAYNAFEMFNEGGGDSRALIDAGQIPGGRQLYFGIYQALYALTPAGLRTFETLEPDFFHLIIIDEAHRSGFGTWNDILKRHPHAIQLGMTATPKRADNIDTYAYFGEPVFTYSLGQGIDDGFLANYKVHHVRSNLDRDGLSIQEAEKEGAHVYVPEGAAPRNEYGTPSFERDVALPDRVRIHCEHLTGLLKLYGRMEKTMVFCVSQDHALEVVKQLNQLNADLDVADYAVRIVSEEATAQSDLERFQTVDRATPVVAVTVDLLTTGVDAPSVRNIVFLRTIASPTVFKQIVGRGTRLCEDKDKYWFRIIDYTGATALFDEWDKPAPLPDSKVQTAGPGVCALAGRVVDSESGAPLVDAVVTVQLGPNQIVQQRTGSGGQFFFAELPAGVVLVTATAYGRTAFSEHATLHAAAVATLTLALPPRKPAQDRQIRVDGVKVTIVHEAYEERDAFGNLVSPQDYLAKVRGEITQVVRSLAELQAWWVDPLRRKELLAALEQHQVALDVLTEILVRPDADAYDILAHLAFDEPLVSREQRAVAFFNLHQDFLAKYDDRAREVLKVLVEKYTLGGLDEVLDPDVYRLRPIHQEAAQVARLFGGMPQLKLARNELIRRLYVQPG